MNKQQLASKIWESANQMRSKIDASEYKDFILGFIFYKFLSQMEVERLQKKGMTADDLPSLVEEDEQMVKFVQDECGYFIAYEDLFQTWIEMGSNFDIACVRDALSAFDRLIVKSKRSVFGGIFNTLQIGLSKLGNDEKSRSKAARDLIYLINDIPMGGRQDYDVIGFIYEYLIGMFASSAGKKAGEFYTPHEVSVLMSQIIAYYLSDREQIKILDPTSGSASLLINIGKAVEQQNGKRDGIKYFAQEMIESTYNLTRMNLIMRGILPDNIVTRNGDTLKDDWPWFDKEENKDETYEPLFVDAVVSNPPYSHHWEPPAPGEDVRFEYGLAPKSKADYAFLQHDLYHLRSDGVMTIVLPHGVLFRGGEEGAIRRNLLEHHNIEAIIGLPANIFFGTGIPTIVMVLRKHRQQDDVLIVDASKGFIKEGKSNKLRASDIRRVVDAVRNRQDIDKFCRVVSLDEIRENDYNLNIPRYVDSSEEAEQSDIYSIMFGGIPQGEIDALAKYWDVFGSLKPELFESVNDHVARLRTDDLRTTVLANAEVCAFQNKFADAFSGYDAFLKGELLGPQGVVDIALEEDRLSSDLRARLKNVPLVDFYSAYQILDDAWQTIEADLETIRSEGFDAVRGVDANMIQKTKAGSKTEEQNGWRGHILPFELVQKTMPPGELSEVDEKSTRVSQIDQELSDLLENMDEEEKGADYSGSINEDGTAFVTAALNKAVKVIGKNPSSEYEEALVKASALIKEQGALKKTIKASLGALNEKTKVIVEDLSDEQAAELLHVKWSADYQQRLKEIPLSIIEDLAGRIKQLSSKYEATYADVCSEIAETEHELAAMLGQLCGNEHDMAGIAELKTLLGGE